MYTIWKFTIPTDKKIEIEMPSEAQILTLKLQKGIPCLWALCVPKNKTVVRNFIIKATGGVIESFKRYHGTFLVDDDSLVWHLFEI